LSHTLTTGVISGLGREIVSQKEDLPIRGVIQTDAAINPGNSGGPLLDSAGRLIGVNTAIFSPSGASAGVGFAVPVDTVRRVVPQIIRTGKPDLVGLGVQILDDSTFEYYRQQGAFPRSGVLVVHVHPGTGAAEAGLEPGDLIFSINDKPVTSSVDLYRRLDGHDAGDVVTVTFLRDGREQTAEVTLKILRTVE
jgi:S1-C subfamily serine protease